MFIDSLENIANIAKNADTCIIATSAPDIETLKIKPFFVLEPDDKGKIPIEATRELIQACSLKQATDAYIIIKGAETMTLEAENALLKLLEEPRNNYHFILFAKDPTSLLPTILSRAEIYYITKANPLSAPVEASKKAKDLAHQLLTTPERDLPDFVDAITKKKLTRPEILEILSAAIEISYKSYFATGRPAFLKKLPNLLAAYNNISKNGHIKLHLIADLL
ncbi:hypothetical protein IKG54_02140 [Candidatus Saccharibacteria bacterium]|nr:hypothetical protein [Candidatus Saccharibacteria bacterium]